MFTSHLYALRILPALFCISEAFIQACIYQSDKCGFTLMSTYGYNLSELIAAVNSTPSIPPISAQQIPQVVFHCEDIYGNITGNSFCINGCLASQSLTTDDDCRIDPGQNGTGACPTTSTVTVTVGPPSPSCFKQCQTWCFGGNIGSDSAVHPMTTPVWLGNGTQS